jgi:hypothetical protein
VVVVDFPELRQRVLVVGDGLLESFNGGQVGLTAAGPTDSSIFAGGHVSPRVMPSSGGRAARRAAGGGSSCSQVTGVAAEDQDWAVRVVGKVFADRAE